MSRLYTVMASAAAIAEHFGAADRGGLPVQTDIIEGNPGMVVGERDGARILKAMDWGFPRLTREMRERGDPPSRIGLVADLTNPMWEKIVVDPRYRCLIPLTHFANPDGEEGKKMRTWFSVKRQPIFAWAGFCRVTPEFGPVYAGMTMTANQSVMPVNDRMPVLLDPCDYDLWLRGSIQDVIKVQFRAPFAAERMDIQETEDRWRSGKQPILKTPQFDLL